MGTGGAVPDIYFQCGCGKNLAADADAEGRQVRCPDCGSALTIPRPAMQWHCTRCGASLQAPREMSGKKVQCLACGSDIEVAEGEPLEAPLGEGGAPPGASHENISARLDSLFKQCPQCHERIPAGTAKCPFCDYSFAGQAPKGVIAGALCAVIVAGILLGLWQAGLWPFRSGRPAVPPPLAAPPPPPPAASAAPAASNAIVAAPAAPPASQTVAAAGSHVPGVVPASASVFNPSDWTARSAVFRRIVDARLDRDFPRWAANQEVSVRLLDGLVIHGTNGGVDAAGIRLAAAGNTLAVAFTNLDAYDRLRADPEFRSAWVDAQALALNRRLWEKEGVAMPALATNGGDRVEQALALGDPEAQYRMGERRLRQKDYAHALLFMQASASQGHPGAQYAAGAMRCQGLGAPADQRAGITWMALAAAQRHAKAEQYLQQYQLSAETRSKLLQQEQSRRENEIAGLAKEFADWLSQSRTPDQVRPSGLSQTP